MISIQSVASATDDSESPDPPPSDTTAPKVVNTVPTADATGVSPAVNVKATFSEDMLASSIDASTFKLFKKGSTTKIAAQVIYPHPNSPPFTAKLDPSSSLTRGVTYKAVVSTGPRMRRATPSTRTPLSVAHSRRCGSSR